MPVCRRWKAVGREKLMRLLNPAARCRPARRRRAKPLRPFSNCHQSLALMPPETRPVVMAASFIFWGVAFFSLGTFLTARSTPGFFDANVRLQHLNSAYTLLQSRVVEIAPELFTFRALASIAIGASP